MPQDNEIKDHEERIEVDGVYGRMLMGIDEEGKKRFLRCDSQGYLLVKAAQIDTEDLED